MLGASRGEYDGADAWPPGRSRRGGDAAGVSTRGHAPQFRRARRRRSGALAVGGQSPTTIPRAGGLAVTYAHPAGSNLTLHEQHGAEHELLRVELGHDHVEPAESWDWVLHRLGAPVTQGRWPGEPAVADFGPVVTTATIAGHADGTHGVTAGTPLVPGAAGRVPRGLGRGHRRRRTRARSRRADRRVRRRGWRGDATTGALRAAVSGGGRGHRGRAGERARPDPRVVGGDDRRAARRAPGTGRRGATRSGRRARAPLPPGRARPGVGTATCVPRSWDCCPAPAPPRSRAPSSKPPGTGSRTSHAIWQRTASPPTCWSSAAHPRRSRVWNEIKASVLGVPVVVPDFTELAAVGAAFAAGAAIGWWPAPGRGRPATGPDRE